jgi:hypothetical protein
VNRNIAKERVEEFCDEVDGSFGNMRSKPEDDVKRNACSFRAGDQTVVVTSDGELTDVSSWGDHAMGTSSRLEGPFDYDIRYGSITFSGEGHSFVSIATDPGEHVDR